MVKKQALGKGISALIPDYPESTQEEGANRVIDLNVDEIEPNPHQPRSEFDEERIDEIQHQVNVMNHQIHDHADVNGPKTERMDTIALDENRLLNMGMRQWPPYFSS